MRYYQKQTQLETRDVLIKLECDICKKSVAKDDWGKEYNQDVNVTIELSDREQWGNDVSGSRIYYEICPDCFKNKLMPFMYSQGAGAIEKDIDY